MSYQDLDDLEGACDESLKEGNLVRYLPIDRVIFEERIVPERILQFPSRPKGEAGESLDNLPSYDRIIRRASDGLSRLNHWSRLVLGAVARGNAASVPFFILNLVHESLSVYQTVRSGIDGFWKADLLQKFCLPIRGQILSEKIIGGLRAIGDAELLVDVGQMEPDRIYRNKQVLGNLRIGFSFGHQF